MARNLAERVDQPDYPLCQQRVLLEVGSRPGTAMAELLAALDIDDLLGQLSDTEQTSLVTAMDTVRGLIGTALRRR